MAKSRNASGRQGKSQAVAKAPCPFARHTAERCKHHWWASITEVSTKGLPMASQNVCMLQAWSLIWGRLFWRSPCWLVFQGTPKENPPAQLRPAFSTAGFSTAGFSTAGFSTAGFSTAGFSTAGFSTAGFSTGRLACAKKASDEARHHCGNQTCLQIVEPPFNCRVIFLISLHNATRYPKQNKQTSSKQAMYSNWSDLGQPNGKGRFSWS